MLSAEDGENAQEVLIAPLEQLIPSSVLLEHSRQLSNLVLQHSALLAQLATIVKLLVSPLWLVHAIQATTAQQHQQSAKQHRDQRLSNALRVITVNQVFPLPNYAQPVLISTKKDNLHVLTVRKAITV